MTSRPGGDDDSMDVMPWKRRPSIFEHLYEHIDSDGCMSEGAERLPDEDRVNQDSELRWAAGALDGIASHHMGSGDVGEQVEAIVTLLLEYCQRPTDANKLAVYERIAAESTISIIDPVIDALSSESTLDQEVLYELSRSFLLDAADREVVKFGIAIVGLYGESENEDLLLTLGRHDEFTLFAAVALSNIGDQPDQSLWRLADNVDGWGRIQVVQRLAETTDPEIKSWLLREGYRNSVMYEYLAYTCAVAGDLLSAMSQQTVDRELLGSAGELIEALIVGGPAEDMDDYADGAAVVEHFLRHIEQAEVEIADLLHVYAVKLFLEEADADWKGRAERGWTPELRAQLHEKCLGLVDRDEWKQRIADALTSEDEDVFYDASRAARALGVDTWPHHWRRLNEQPGESGRWYEVMATVTDETLPQTLALAAQAIDLNQIASGASDELGMGPEYEQHSCLDYVLQELSRFPGQGVPLIDAGLKSPVIRNRNLAINALSAWPRDTLSDSLLATLEAAVSVEPDEEIRERLIEILSS